ncbi:MAG: hypothetical protein P8P74_11290 [Crocinitomicaceae bacterium]|nr:hypothetical protein [Crocinitomicaceae bacterium]
MNRLIIFFLLLSGSTVAQTVTISGIAPSYVGKDIEVYEIEDYLSNTERLITSTKVEDDSTFTLKFANPTIRKVAIKGLNNKGYMYVQAKAKYRIFVPKKDKFDPYRPTGNSIEIGFLSLDSTDINYKILGFQRWMDRFVGYNFHLRGYDNVLFNQRLDTFKTNVEKAYAKDTSKFLKTYVRFSIAGLDNIEQGAARNRYEKHDFYIKQSTVYYQNDAYMDYIAGFYQKMIPRLSNETNQAVYMGVLKSSPSAIMNALGREYTLINLRIREMVMVKALADEYHSSDFPKTNILTILDSVADNSLFEANAVIAKNMRARLTELVPGAKAPDFVLAQQGLKTKTLFSFKDQYLYMHFIDPNNQQSIKELELLKAANEKYGNYIQFVTIYRDGDNLETESLNKVQQLPWDVYGIAPGNSLWKNYQIEAFPHFVLIDATANIVASPALGPTPNGQYETIDKTFFAIKKLVDYENRDPENPYDGINGGQ